MLRTFFENPLYKILNFLITETDMWLLKVNAKISAIPDKVF